MAVFHRVGSDLRAEVPHPRTAVTAVSGFPSPPWPVGHVDLGQPGHLGAAETSGRAWAQALLAIATRSSCGAQIRPVWRGGATFFARVAGPRPVCCQLYITGIIGGKTTRSAEQHQDHVRRRPAGPLP